MCCLLVVREKHRRTVGCSWGWEKECSERLYSQVYDHIPSCIQTFWMGPMVLEYKTLRRVNQGNFLLFSVVALDAVVGWHSEPLHKGRWNEWLISWVILVRKKTQSILLCLWTNCLQRNCFSWVLRAPSLTWTAFFMGRSTWVQVVYNWGVSLPNS